MITSTASSDARGIGLNEQAIVSTVFGLEGADFAHAMASENDQARQEGLWQDVYTPIVDDRRLYVKIQINNQARLIIVSFKPKRQ